MSANTLYDLTPLTGRNSSAQRTWIFASVEMPRRVAIILIISMVPTLMVCAALWVFLGAYVLLVVPIIPAASVFLFHARSTQGLELHHHKRFMDRKKAKLNTVLICGMPVDAFETRIARIVSSSTVYQDLREPAAMGGVPHRNNEPAHVIEQPGLAEVFG